MLFNTLYLTFLLSTLSAGLPLEGALQPREIIPRAKSYAIVNVDGGSSTPPPAETTTVTEDKTKTIKVTDAASTPTDTATATLHPTPAPTGSERSSGPTRATSSSPATTPQPKPSSSERPVATPAPSIVTIVITETAAPTEYYDNGMWHTSYVVKTFWAAAVASSTISTSTVAASASPSLPILEDAALSYNQTHGRRAAWMRRDEGTFAD
ncbi:hypothetical protein BU26DRAFT_172689 [Trematosphaeria pertusa]|uniref:Uncharacterized protein n=1 Tax=Trematosphaeria pertusa TaxID=390896 RepID=A0A6A6HU40_9PLEO|nr:uncharacterized protein BU26DRAFT_172689 [Trematosphaeria pertusa]KAF2241547.1 hypothetical protein BU26DRAFT_172689 [Trematosphaeria pertusa]